MFATAGYIIFAIGFADADYGELVNMASKPSERHVFFVDDLDAVKKIEEQLITFVCEAATASESSPAPATGLLLSRETRNRLECSLTQTFRCHGGKQVD